VTEIDPKLSRLYRQTSTDGPPAALDAAILAAARKQVAQPRRRERAQRDESFWSRWMVPASAIATLVLGVSIALLVEREQPSGDTAIRRTPPRPQSPLPARVPEAAEVKAADSATPAAAAKKEAPATDVPVRAPAAAAPAQVPATAAPAQAPATAAPARAPAAAAPAQAPAATLPAPAPVPRSAEPAAPAAEAFPAESRAKASASGTVRQSNVAGDSAIGGLGAAAPAAPAVAAKRSPLPQRAAGLSPEAWLDEISRLKRDGREKEAAEQLAKFRKAYPAYAVPEALRGLE
jgi:resuscitation-promoting factor RpfA